MVIFLLNPLGYMCLSQPILTTALMYVYVHHQTAVTGGRPEKHPPRDSALFVNHQPHAVLRAVQVSQSRDTVHLLSNSSRLPQINAKKCDLATFRTPDFADWVAPFGSPLLAPARNKL